jgi:hypothetical protein
MAPTGRAKEERDGGEAVPIATTKVDEEDWSSVEECWVCVSEFGWLVELEDEVGWLDEVAPEEDDEEEDRDREEGEEGAEGEEGVIVFCWGVVIWNVMPCM